ncbi:zinc knuckle CX2CX4HX4C containing protein [Tanacetum coccineum]
MLCSIVSEFWTLNTVLKKKEIKNAPVWVKLRHVPIVAYSEIGLSLITTQIGRPIDVRHPILAQYLRSWGRKSDSLRIDASDRRSLQFESCSEGLKEEGKIFAQQKALLITQSIIKSIYLLAFGSIDQEISKISRSQQIETDPC